MANWILVGRIVFSLIFIGSAIGQFAQRDDSVGYATGKGVPNPEAAVTANALLHAASGIGIALGIWTDLAFLLAAVHVLALAFIAHRFWELEGAEMAAEMPQFMKNVTIAGACIMGFGLHAYGWEARQLVGPLFDLG